MISRTIHLWQTALRNPHPDLMACWQSEDKYLESIIDSDTVVLDLGCGTGRSIKNLAHQVKTFIGIDNDNEAIDEAQKQLADFKNVALFLQDAESMEFADESFDIVFCGLTFCNFYLARQKILSEVARVLKNDGKFIFSSYNEEALDTRMKIYDKYPGGYEIVDSKRGTVRTNSGGAFSEQFDLEEIRNILSLAGLEIVDSQKGKIFYIINSRKK